MPTLLETARKQWGRFLRKFSLPLVLGSSALLFSLSTVLHFTQQGSLVEFLAGIMTIVPASSIIRFATKDIILKLESKEYEFLAGLLNGILGYTS